MAESENTVNLAFKNMLGTRNPGRDQSFLAPAEVAALLERGADVNAVCKPGSKDEGDTVLHLAKTSPRRQADHESMFFRRVRGLHAFRHRGL